MPIGSMAKLTFLSLAGNAIGDVGMQAFAEAIGNGLLPACKAIVVYRNPGNSAPLKAACEERGIDCFLLNFDYG